MSTGVFYFLALFYSDLLTPQKLQRITGATTVRRQASFAFVISARGPKKHAATPSPYASQHHQTTIFTFLLVNHQLLFESETNDRRSSPLAHHHVGRTAKPGSLTNARPRQAGGELKRPSSNGPAGFQRISH